MFDELNVRRIEQSPFANTRWWFVAYVNNKIYNSLHTASCLGGSVCLYLLCSFLFISKIMENSEINYDIFRITEINYFYGNILEINYLSKIMVWSIIFSVALIMSDQRLQVSFEASLSDRLIKFCTFWEHLRFISAEKSRTPTLDLKNVSIAIQCKWTKILMHMNIELLAQQHFVSQHWTFKGKVANMDLIKLGSLLTELAWECGVYDGVSCESEMIAGIGQG